MGKEAGNGPFLKRLSTGFAPKYCILKVLKNCQFLRIVIISVTRLGYFWKLPARNFLTKVAQTFDDYLGCIEKCHFLVQTWLLVGATLGNIWATFLQQHLVTLSCNRTKVEIKRLIKITTKWRARSWNENLEVSTSKFNLGFAASF